jgi:hypothetical protein
MNVRKKICRNYDDETYNFILMAFCRYAITDKKETKNKTLFFSKQLLMLQTLKSKNKFAIQNR